MLALDLLRVVLANSMFIGIQMSLVSPPPIGVIPRDAKGLQQRLQLQKNAMILLVILKVPTIVPCICRY